MFLKRKRGDTGRCGDVRPVKRYRRSAYQFTCHMHNTLAPVVENGLLYFAVTPDIMEKVPARFWRRLSMHPDQRGEGVAAMSHMTHRLGIDCDVVYDWGHDTHKDIDNGLADAKLKSHMSMALFRVNIPASPWDTRSRWKQVIGRLDDMFRNESPATNYIFREMSPRLLSEPAVRQYRYDLNPEQALWDGMEERNAFTIAGAKILKPILRCGEKVESGGWPGWAKEVRLLVESHGHGYDDQGRLHQIGDGWRRSQAHNQHQD